MEYVKSDGVSISRSTETEREKTPLVLFRMFVLSRVLFSLGSTMPVKSTAASRFSELGRNGGWERFCVKQVDLVTRLDKRCSSSARRVPYLRGHLGNNRRVVVCLPSKPSPLTGLPTFPARDLLAIFYRTLHVATLVCFLESGPVFMYI